MSEAYIDEKAEGLRRGSKHKKCTIEVATEDVPAKKAKIDKQNNDVDLLGV